MKLVQTDTQEPRSPAAEPVLTPPRPEHRNVQVSLCITLVVLIVTVATVYLVVPERHNEVMTEALLRHQTPANFDLENPTHAELTAWSVALLGKNVPWPQQQPAMKILGTTSLSILRNPAAFVRYRIHGMDISLLIQRARDTPPRRHSRIDKDIAVVSFRNKRWTVVGVGPAATREQWKRLIGAP